MNTKKDEHIPGRANASDTHDYNENGFMKDLIADVYRENNKQNIFALMTGLLTAMEKNLEAPTPMVDVDHMLEKIDLDALCEAKPFPKDLNLRLMIDRMQDGGGKLWLPLFTDQDEIEKGETTNIIMNMPIRLILESALNYENVDGVVINPFGQAYTIPNPILELLLERLAAIEMNMQS